MSVHLSVLIVMLLNPYYLSALILKVTGNCEKYAGISGNYTYYKTEEDGRYIKWLIIFVFRETIFLDLLSSIHPWIITSTTVIELREVKDGW